MVYFCAVKMKSINRFLIPVLILVLIGYFRLDLNLFQGKQFHTASKEIERQEQLEPGSLYNDHVQTIKPSTKGKRKKRCKAIISLSESQEEDNDDDENSDDKQNTLQKYVKHIGCAAIFLSHTTGFTSFNYSSGYINPQEPFAHRLSNKNILFRVFRI